MKTDKTKTCVFCFNCSKPFMEERQSCDMVREQIKYVNQRLGINRFVILKTTDAEIQFCRLVDEYREKMHRIRQIEAVLAIKKRTDDVHSTISYISCLQKPSGTKPEEFALNSADCLILLNDWIKGIPQIYMLARDRRIPIFFLNPQKKIYEIENSIYPIHTFKDVYVNFPENHGLKTQYKTLQKYLGFFYERLHFTQVHEFLYREGTEQFDKDVLVEVEYWKREYINNIREIRKEMRVVNSLIKFKNNALTALYWMARESSIQYTRAFYGEAHEATISQEDVIIIETSPETERKGKEARRCLAVFKEHFNKKADEKHGFIIHGKLFLG